MHAVSAPVQPRIVGRYALFGELAAGGMATVHFGRLVGAVGFSRTVAIKRLHPQFAKDPDFVGMFLDEARLAARIQHPNVVSTLDVVPIEGEVFLVMEYVHGEALSKLIRAARKNQQLVPPRIAVAILAGALHGLHAAHEAKSERGEPLGIVHRDVSPQNILVGTDGVPRVLDFGVAKAAARVTSTRDGQMKGKVSYMAPEQMRGRGVDRRTDVFAAGVVLWEALTGRRLFDGQDPGEILAKLLEARIPRPAEVEPSIPSQLDDIVMRALSRDINQRWSSARELAIALEHTGAIALPREVGEWVESVGGDVLAERAAHVAAIESASTTDATYSASGAQLAAAHISGGWPAQGEPTTSPSQVSHVTGISHPGLSSPSYPSAPSQASGSLSIAQPRSGRKAAVAALAGVAVALALVLVLAVGALVLRNRRAPAEEPDVLPAKNQPVAATAETAQPAPTNPPVASAVAPDTAPTASAAPPPEESAEPAVPAAPKTKKPATVYKPIKPAATASKPPAANCDPPFTVDKNGVRRVKPGCM